MTTSAEVPVAIWPTDAGHLAHMESWCDGTSLRDAGGVGASPKLGGFLHILHMAGYCRARGERHTFADELWAGPPVVFATIGVLLLLCTYCCIRTCCCTGKRVNFVY
jgi:hypothetical protein